jgi:hypothetical protein
MRLSLDLSWKAAAFHSCATFLSAALGTVGAAQRCSPATPYIDRRR